MCRQSEYPVSEGWHHANCFNKQFPQQPFIYTKRVLSNNLKMTVSRSTSQLQLCDWPLSGIVSTNNVDRSSLLQVSHKQLCVTFIKKKTFEANIFTKHQMECSNASCVYVLADLFMKSKEQVSWLISELLCQWILLPSKVDTWSHLACTAMLMSECKTILVAGLLNANNVNVLRVRVGRDYTVVIRTLVKIYPLGQWHICWYAEFCFSLINQITCKPVRGSAISLNEWRQCWHGLFTVGSEQDVHFLL